MNKRIRIVLKVLGCIVLSTSMLLSACRPMKSDGRKKMTKRTSEETSETTEDPTDTTDTSDSQAPTDTAVPTNPVQKKYTGAEAAKKLHEIDEEIFKQGMTDIWTLTDALEDPSAAGIDWPDVGIEQWKPDDGTGHDEIKKILQTLEEIDEDSLELEDQILLDTMKRDYALSDAMYDMEYYTPSMNSLTGINVELPTSLSVLTFDDKDDAERYLKMLADTKPYLESLFEYEKKRAELGWSLPDENLDHLIESFNTVYKDHDGNYMYTTFDERVKALGLDDATTKDLIARNKEILDTSFFPVYDEMAKNLETLRGTAKTSGKICEMDGGKEFYEKYFQVRSGTSLTIDEAKKILETKIQEEYLDFYSKLLTLSPEQQEQMMDPDKMQKITDGLCL